MVALLALSSGAVRAALVSDLYEAEVAVGNRGDGARAAAVGDGLAQVIVKVSGRRGALELPVVAAALRAPERFLQQFSYREAAADGGLFLSLRFDEAAVRGMLLEAGAPLWTNRRPPVLLWLAVDTGSGPRRYVDDAPGGLEAMVRDALARRGVPSSLPLYDLTDRAALAPAAIWRLDTIPLAAASARYAAEHVLAGRVLHLSGGRWLGDWTYLHAGERLDRAVTARSAADFAAEGAALAADAMARRYAVSPQAGPRAGAVRVLVLDVRSFASYAAIMGWFEGLDLVDSVTPVEVAGSRLTLELDARAGVDRLAPVIELNERLRPASSPGRERADRVYRWRD